MVPILLLTGFLGSGKTTLLNRLLENRPSSGPFAEATGPLALVVNEFGDVGIDGDLLPDEMTRQIEIKGGCICCRLDGNLEKTLHELLASQPNLTAIIIETTGIAEPLPISWTLAKEELASVVRLAAVMTTVDVTMHSEHRSLSPSVDAQVEYGDLLLLTKRDLLTNDASLIEEKVRSELRELNQVAPILVGDAKDLVAQLWQALDDPQIGTQRVAPTSAETHSHGFQSISEPISELLDFEILSEELESLPPNFVRVKGIARVVDEASGSTTPHFVAFHRVGARVSHEPVKGPLETRIVAIGSDLDMAALATCISSAVIESP